MGVVVPVLLGAMAAALAWLGLVLVGTVRQVEDLELRLAVLGMAMPGRVGRTGLPVGATAPGFEAPTLDGATFSSGTWRGREHLVLFAHPGCAPCETVVPEVLRSAGRGILPPSIVVSEGPAHPSTWDGVSGAEGRAVVVLQERSAIARRFETFITPHLFVVGPSGRVLAQGVAGTLEEARALVRRARRRRDELPVEARAGGLR